MLGIVFITKWVYCALIRRNAGDRLPYPPGPKAIPFIGNVLDLPMQDAACIFAGCSQKFQSKFLIMCKETFNIGPIKQVEYSMLVHSGCI